MTESKRARRTFTAEFKNQMVQLYLNGKRKVDIVREYDLSATAFDRWIKQATMSGSFNEKDNRTPEEDELIRLQKRVKQLEMENLEDLFGRRVDVVISDEIKDALKKSIVESARSAKGA